MVLCLGDGAGGCEGGGVEGGGGWELQQRHVQGVEVFVILAHFDIRWGVRARDSEEKSINVIPHMNTGSSFWDVSIPSPALIGVLFGTFLHFLIFQSVSSV